MDVKKDHERLLQNLRTIQKNYKVQELAAVLGISTVTWTARMKEPWRLFSYDDFRLLAKYCKVDFVHIVDGTIGLKGE